MDGNELNYQTGKRTVESPDIDAAGDEHPLGSDPLPFDGNMMTIIRDLAENQYSHWSEAIREYIANAETACQRVERENDLYGADNYTPIIEITLRKDDEKFIIRDNGIGMSSEELDKVYRMVGHTTSMDTGDLSGQFGWGALSFSMMTGSSSEMMMTTHSRRTDENYSCLVTLAGPEPIMGQFGEDEYGTEFSMNIKDGVDMDEVFDYVQKYSEWLRVPVLYREYDENGKETMKEEFGLKTLPEQYDDETGVVFEDSKEGFYEAYATVNANRKTLLCSMEIDRGCGDMHKIFPIDVRIEREDGCIVHSTNGNEGLVPTTETDYKEMLLRARPNHVPESYLKSSDTVGADVISGPHEGKTVVSRDVYENKVPDAQKDSFVTMDDVSEDEISDEYVISGGSDRKGRVVVSDEEWNEMDEGRAAQYIPETRIEKWDGESGDLRLPSPTSDRGRLKNAEPFMKWVAGRLDDIVLDKTNELARGYEQADDQDAFLEQAPLNLLKALLDNSGVQTGHEMFRRAEILSTEFESSAGRRTVREINKMDGDVYMYVSPNREKMRHVKDRGEIVVNVRSVDVMEELSNVLGWEKLKDVWTIPRV